MIFCMRGLDERDMRPAISVIIPVYNIKEYLTRCVASLKSQTMSNIEICLIDDGSTDGSAEICDQLAARDSRIRVVHKRNEGQGIARNVGIEMATGTYVAFLDSDDYWDTDGCRKILERLRETDADLCAFGYCKESEAGESLGSPSIRKACYRDNEIREQFILHFFGDDPYDDDLRGVSACMSCYRRSIVMEHGVRFASERKVLSEDTIFNLEFCKHCRSAATLPDVIYHYVMHKASHTHRLDTARMQRTLEFCDLLRDYAKDYGLMTDQDRSGKLACGISDANVDSDPGVERRLQNTIWISVMEMVRQYAQQPGGLSQIRAFLRHEAVRKNTKYMAGLPIGSKQRLLCSCIRHGNALAVYWMGRLHS